MLTFYKETPIADQGVVGTSKSVVGLSVPGPSTKEKVKPDSVAGRKKRNHVDAKTVDQVQVVIQINDLFKIYGCINQYTEIITNYSQSLRRLKRRISKCTPGVTVKGKQR